MDNQPNEITLGQLFSVVKKSLKRALLYILITLILTVAVTTTIRAFTSYKMYSTTITFNESSENYISVLNSSKTNVVGKALENRKDALEISDEILENLSISAVVPKKLEDEENFIPKSFVISLKSSRNIKLTSTEYKQLLDKVSNGFINVFAINTLSTLFTEYKYDSSSEYIQSAYELEEKSQAVYNYLFSYINVNPSIGSFKNSETGNSLQNILEEINLISNSARNVQNDIILTKAEKSEGSLKKYIEILAERAEGDTEYYKTKYDSAVKALEDLSTLINKNVASSSTTGVDGITYYMDTTLYEKLTQQVIEFAGQWQTAAKTSTLLRSYVSDSKIGSVVNSDITGETINNKLNELYRKLNTCIEEYKETANEYNQNQYLTSSAKKVNAAHEVTESFMTLKLIIIVCIAAILIAYMVAFGKTFSIYKKKNFSDEVTPAK